MGNNRGTNGTRCKVTGECRGTPEECKRVGPKCQGNARGMYRRVYKVPGECRGIPGECMGVGAKCQGNVGQFRGMPGNLWEWVQSAKGMQVNVRE